MTVKSKVKKWIIELGLLLNLDIRIGKKTPIQELTKLLRDLRPVKTNLELIRMGSIKDGGYLIVDDLENIDALISPGVGNKQDFDLDCAKLGMNVYMADNSVEGPIINHEKFNFIKKHLNTIDDEHNITMETWLHDIELNHGNDLILQMDIEGGEYDIICNIKTETLNKFRIIIIEFHQLDMLWGNNYYRRIKKAFDRILKSHYIVHMHPNNCCKAYKCGSIEIPPVMEMTFVRKERAITYGYVEKYPHPLDVDCTADETIVLPKCFYTEIVD